MPYSPSQIVAQFNQNMCASGTSYVVIYTDTVDVLTGKLGVRMGSNVQPAQIAGLLGSLLEPGARVRGLLSDLFKAHPLQVPKAPVDPNDPEAKPEFVEVPVEQAVEMVVGLLMTNMELKGAQKRSPLLVL